MPMSPTDHGCDTEDARTFRRAAARFRLARAAGTAAAAAAAWCAACSSTGTPRVTDRLDPVTGNTVVVLAQPAELVTAESRGPSGDPFAFAAPFSVDRMGNRELYLWVSVPQDAGMPTHLQVLCDARPLDLAAARLDLGRLQLSRPPYAPVAPWSGEWSLRLPAAALTCLAAARSMTIEYEVRGGHGVHEERFTADADNLKAFATFAAHLGAE